VLAPNNYRSERSFEGTGCPVRNRQHRNLARRTIELHQSAAEELLLICCKKSGGPREATPTDPDLSSKTIGLESLDSTGKTGAREICC
jgi:hypothetical protein